MRTLTFRTTVTLAVLGIITTLALCLIAMQAAVFRSATKAAALAQMDVTAAGTLTSLRSDISELEAILHIVAKNPFLADSNQRSETGGAVGLFRTALRHLPQADSIYVGYDNACWLQVRGIGDLTEAERDRIGAPANASYMVSLVLPTDTGKLPLRRVFQDGLGNNTEEHVIPQYGYDIRKREWYRPRRCRRIDLPFRGLISPIASARPS
jgi:adenylate cyclase